MEIVESDERKKAADAKAEAKGESIRAACDGTSVRNDVVFNLNSLFFFSFFSSSRPGQPPSGGAGSVGGLRRPDGGSERRRRRRLGGRKFPPAAETARLLPAADHTQREEQRGRPRKGERDVLQHVVNIMYIKIH